MAAALSACSAESSYYVKTDGSPDVLHGVAHLAAPAAPTVRLDLGVTFKSDGKVLPAASDLLFQSVSDGLRAKGEWDVHRLGSSSQDFAPAIVAVIRAPAGSAMKAKDPAAVVQRMLELVQNSPDVSTGTQINYFLSGMSFGVHGLHKATDRYDVTILYRDAGGIDHVYRSHQDLLLSTSNKLLGNDDRAMAGLSRYDTALAAFNGVVNNSVNGTQKGVILVGKPQISQQPGQSGLLVKPALP